MRLLWVTENYPPQRGGMAESCDRLVHGLRQANVEVDVAHFTRHAAATSICRKQLGRDIVHPIGPDAAHAMNTLFSQLTPGDGRPAYTHVVAFGGQIPLCAAPVYAAWLGAPLVTLLRGNDFDIGVFAPQRIEPLQRALLQARAVCAVSQDKLTKIRALYPGVEPLYVPNGIELSSWLPLPSQLQAARTWRAQHVQEGRRVLGMFGHVKRKKGGQFFLEALLASGQAARFHLLFVGEIEQDILDFLEANKEQIQYSLVPVVERYELLGIYPACDLCVIASFYDGLPNVLLESCALSVPLLVSDAGGMKALLRDEVHCFQFRAGDAADCRLAITRAARAQADELLRMGQACASMVREKLTAQHEIEAYLKVLRSVQTVNGASRQNIEDHP